MSAGISIKKMIISKSATVAGLSAIAALLGGGTAQAQGFVGWYAPPRTYGIEASMKF